MYAETIHEETIILNMGAARKLSTTRNGETEKLKRILKTCFVRASVSIGMKLNIIT